MKTLFLTLPFLTLAACSSVDAPDRVYQNTPSGWVDVTGPSPTQRAAYTAAYLASRFCYGYADGVNRYNAAHPPDCDESAYDIASKLRAAGY